MVKQYEGARLGDNITKVAEGMIALVCEGGEDVVAQLWQADEQAFKNSPYGMGEAKRKEKVLEAKQKHDSLMQELPNLDFAHRGAVLDWLCQFLVVHECGGFEDEREKVQFILERRGYRANMNTRQEGTHKPDGADNVAHYIVGQALDGAPSGFIKGFKRQWKRKFGRGQA